MPFWKKDSVPQVRRLVEGEDYDQIAALAAKDAGAAVQLTKLLLDSDEEVRLSAAYGLASIGKNEQEMPDAIRTVVPELTSLLGHPEAEVRHAASSAVAGVVWNWLTWEDFSEIAKTVLPQVTKLLDDPDARVRTKATEATKVLAEWAEEGGDTSRLEDAVPQLVQNLEDPDGDLRGEAMWAIRAIADRRPDLVADSAGIISSLLEDPDDHTCLGASLAMKYLAEAHVESVKSEGARLVALVEGPDRWGGLANDYGAVALGFVGAEMHALREQIAPKLKECLKNDRGTVREDAARVLASIGASDPELVAPAVPLLEEMLQSQKNDVREAAALALKSVAGHSIP